MLILCKQKASIFGLDARITLLIIAILGLIIAPPFLSLISKSKAEAIISTMRNIDSAIENYILDTHAVPATIDNLYSTLPADATQQTRWNGPYLAGDTSNKLAPTLTWTLESDNCVSGTAHKFCSYTLQMSFSDVSNSVYKYMQTNYADAYGVSYNSTTDILTVDYGQSKEGTYKRIKYRTTETP